MALRVRQFAASGVRAFEGPKVAALVAALWLTGSAAMASAAVPIVSGVSPNKGSTDGGTPVTISGSNFTGTTNVAFNGRNASEIVVIDDNTITCKTPASPVGPAAVSVTNGDGTGTLNNAFYFGITPTAVDDAFSTPFNTRFRVDAPGVLSNDNTNGGGTMTAQIETGTANGIEILESNGTLTYAPNPGFTGVDTLTYRAVNDGGAGNLATVTLTVTAPLGPQPPVGLYVSGITGNVVTFRWTVPPGGETPTNFAVEGGINPGEVLASFVTPNAYPIFTLTVPNGSFYFRVHTISGANRSGPSNEVRVFVNTPVPPSAPDSLAAVANGANLGLSWRNTFGGGVPTSVVLDVTGSVVTSLVLGPTESFSFSGVPAGTYTFSVRATNAAGSSAPSSPVTLSFPQPCSGVPLAPANFLAYKSGSTIFVIWDPPPAGAAATGYILTVTGSFVGSFPTTGRSLSGGVAPGIYTLSVVATNACGGGAPTAPQTVTIP